MKKELQEASNNLAIVLSHGVGGLGAIRSLARRGIEVIMIAYDESDISRHSRYPIQKFLLRGQNHDQKEQHLLEILLELPVNDAAILTNSDRMVSVISRERGLLGDKFRYALPPPDIVDALNDKRQETKLIESLGFNVPRTETKLPEHAEELTDKLRLPIIFKPHSYLAESQFPYKNAIVSSMQELDDFYATWRGAIPALLAQEIIPGPDSFSWICSCTFDENHDLLDCGVKQKIRAFPAHYGGSSFAISGQNDEVVQLTRRLGKQLKYVGHAGVEFRWDEREKCYQYIEINPRLPANVGFDEACGLPTVVNSFHVSLGTETKHSGIQQKDGVYFVDLTGDFESQRADGVAVWRIAIGYLKLLVVPTSGLYFAWDDPKPAMIKTVQFLKSAVKRLLHTVRGRTATVVQKANIGKSL